jgi:transposase
MAGKPKEMSQIKQLLRMHSQGLGKQTIAKRLDISKNTVKSYLSRYDSLDKELNDLLELSDPELERIFFAGNPSYKERDRYEGLQNLLPYYEQELKRRGVNRQLLWEEYISSHPEGYSRSQFCFHLQQHLDAKKSSMVLSHLPGSCLYVDFAGKKMNYVDKQTGEIIECEVFVACLPYSDYGFVMAVPSQKSEDFIYCLERCLAFIGGVPQTIVTDNLKSAVVKTDRYEPDINRVLEDFANHYGTTICPARAYKPQDKALVENTVKLVYNRVYARLRDDVFFDLPSLNEAMQGKMLLHNQTRMQQKPYCREEMFVSSEKACLSSLPATGFEIKTYKELKVTKNNHIQLKPDNHYYSVPHTCIGKTAKVIYTRSLVYIYVDGQQVAVHKRIKAFGYSTEKEHLCSIHKHYLERSPDYYKNKAKEHSSSFLELTECIFGQARYPEQLYRSCDGLLRLARQTDKEVFEEACRIAIQHQHYSYKSLLNLVQNNMATHQQDSLFKPLPSHGNIRGKYQYQ